MLKEYDEMQSDSKWCTSLLPGRDLSPAVPSTNRENALEGTGNKALFEALFTLNMISEFHRFSQCISFIFDTVSFAPNR
jgi:hypothetical protein